MHKDIEDALNQIDAALFSGDTFFQRDNLEELKKMLDRWQKQVPWLEEMASLREADTAEE